MNSAVLKHNPEVIVIHLPVDGVVPPGLAGLPIAHAVGGSKESVRTPNLVATARALGLPYGD